MTEKPPPPNLHQPLTKIETRNETTNRIARDLIAQEAAATAAKTARLRTQRLRMSSRENDKA